MEVRGLAVLVWVGVQDVHGTVVVQTHAAGLQDRGGAVRGGDGGQAVVEVTGVRGASVDGRYGIDERLKGPN